MDTKTFLRVAPVSAEQATPEVHQMYQQIEQSMHMVPNIFKNMGNSGAVLQGYMALQEAVQKTSLSPQLREKIALTVAQANNCNYCLAVHTIQGRDMGVANIDILQARQGMATQPKEKAILKFAQLVVEKRGNVTDQDVQDLKTQGVSDTELVEIILATHINMFTNYFNHITGTEVDFPAAPPLR